MAGFEELNDLTSEELHDRAVKIAERRVDFKFFYGLAELIPAAELSLGQEGDAEADIGSMRALFKAWTQTDDGPLADALRPYYIDYIQQHG